MSINAFDAAVAGESVLVTETRMEELQLLGRVGSTSFVIAGSRRNFSPESLNPYELLGAALGSSTAMTLRLYADRMGLPLVRIQVSVSHHPSGENCAAAFERSIILEGDLSAEQRQRLLEVVRRWWWFWVSYWLGLSGVLRGLGLLGALSFRMVHDDFHVQAAQLGQQRV